MIRFSSILFSRQRNQTGPIVRFSEKGSRLIGCPYVIIGCRACMLPLSPFPPKFPRFLPQVFSKCVCIAKKYSVTRNNLHLITHSLAQSMKTSKSSHKDMEHSGKIGHICQDSNS